jgi:hypothetical protein
MAAEFPTEAFAAMAPFDLQSALARWSESHRKAAHGFLDFYEKTAAELIDAHLETARAIDIPGVATLAEAQCELSRDVAEACVATARKLLDG